ncbi:MAG: S41 family peptidase [Verrucomicrobium sp.]|nr:S41 family peptidase [Verrucomicrobium sp.]
MKITSTLAASLCLLWGATFANVAVAQDSEADMAGVTALVREAVGQLNAVAYRNDPIPLIYTKALRGLVATLGEGARSQDKDLTTMIDGAAEAEFMSSLQALSTAPGQRQSLRDLAEQAIKIYCKQHDPYTRYVEADDVRLAQLMGKTTGSGVGMSINEKNGVFFCYPLPGSPAEAAGVKAGDKLLTVDGKPVVEKPLEYLAGLIRGAPGTEVNLRVEHGFGRAQTVRVTREALTTPSVFTEKKVTGFVLRVRKFSKELIEETRSALSQISQGSTLTLDLRGCPGGDLDVAIQFASLFLDAGEPIVTVRTRGKPDEVNSATKPREIKPAAIVLLQDEGTASAAELVIAALVNSKMARAASQGAKTYGKGVLQTRIELRGGGVLTLTTGELIAPQGQTWDLVGLLPSLDNRGRIFARD